MTDAEPRRPLGPRARAVADRVRAMIADGEVLRGGRLPAERLLAAKLSVSRSTLRAAMSALEGEEVVRREAGRGGGTFATRPNVNWPLATDPFLEPRERVIERCTGPGQPLGIPSMLASQGFAAATDVVATRVDRAGRYSRDLQLDESDQIFVLERLRLADGRPISWETMRVPQKRFPDLLERGVTGSLWDLFEIGYGLRFGRIEEHVEIVLAEQRYASLLETTAGQPMLQVTRTASDADGVPIECSVDVFRGDRTRLVVRPSAAGRASPSSHGRPLGSTRGPLSAPTG